jgi:uncharacterized protein
LKYLVALVLGLTSSFGEHLLLSEVCVTPNEAEFIEIYNPGAVSVDLSDYYVCDLYGASAAVTSFYPQLVAGQVVNNVNGFCVRFPAGSSIAPGDVITIAMSGTMFNAQFSSPPDYELLGTGSGAMMTMPANGFIGSAPGLTNGAEVVMLFHWTGGSDLVQDVDYALWGDDATRRVEKTGISLDGPDSDTSPSPYSTDTAAASQISIAASTHPSGSSWQRVDFDEGSEVLTGGNGITGHNETSENLDVTWAAATCSPGYISTGLERNTWAEIKSLYNTN